MIFITGGARSGKSSLANSMAARAGLPVRVVVTARVDDEEMAHRVEEHRRRRPYQWTVVESPFDLTAPLGDAGGEEVVVIDCITLWVSNLMVDHDDEAILTLIDGAVAMAAQREAPTIVVSNEVGSGLVPMDPVGRRFRDLQGRANQAFSAAAATAYLAVAGRAVRLDDHVDHI